MWSEISICPKSLQFLLPFQFLCANCSAEGILSWSSIQRKILTLKVIPSPQIFISFHLLHPQKVRFLYKDLVEKWPFFSNTHVTLSLSSVRVTQDNRFCKDCHSCTSSGPKLLPKLIFQSPFFIQLIYSTSRTLEFLLNLIFKGPLPYHVSCQNNTPLFDTLYLSQTKT